MVGKFCINSLNLLTLICSESGVVGKGKFSTLSMFMSFICSTKSSTGRLVISGGENWGKLSLNTADEYNLEIICDKTMRKISYYTST